MSSQISTNDSDNQKPSYSHEDDFVMIGSLRILKSDLVQAFGGRMQVEQYAPAPSRKFANPAPLGLCGFALTTFVLSMSNARAMGISIPNVVVGLALFYGGFIQLLAGMWEIAVENTFGGVVLTSYGGFWMSWAAIQIPWFGIKAAYADHPKQLTDALGFFLLGWTLFTTMILLCTMKSTWAFFSLFAVLEVTFLLLTIAEFTGNLKVTRAAGGCGVVTAFIAWYIAYAGISNTENSYLQVKVFPMPSLKHSLV